MRKYVDDMVLKGAGAGFGPKLADGYHATRRGLTAVNMKVHPSKTVCVGNGRLARKVLQTFTKHRRLPRMVVTTKDLGVDVQWTARRILTQQIRVQNFRKGMD
eukprot:4735954-Amphidinium_carterae.1